MKPMLRRTAVVAVVLAAFAGFYYFGSKYLWPEPNTNTIESVGIVEAPEVNITSRIAGRIKQLDLIEGDRVEKGEVVFRIEDVDIRNQLAQSKAQLAKAEADLDNNARTIKRYRELYAQRVISAQARDDALSAFEQSRASFFAARANVKYYADQLADTVVRSPISGVVVSKNLEVGEWVTPGTSVLTVDDLSTIWARVDVQESDLVYIHLGDPARVTLPTKPPMMFTGRVMAIGQEGQFATETDVKRGQQNIRTFYVKVRMFQVTNEVQPGMTAEVSFSKQYGVKTASHPGA